MKKMHYNPQEKRETTSNNFSPKRKDQVTRKDVGKRKLDRISGNYKSIIYY
jgi:hypothetical protein